MENSRALEELVAVIEKLTSPEGCPWDREQTPKTLADYFIEESHELVAAIRFGTPHEVMGELGDLAFLILFAAHLYAREGAFTFADVLLNSRDKMIHRHPHVFGGTHFENRDEQLAAWEKLKKEEKDVREGALAGIPKSLPPLVRAYRLHSRAARAGFTWENDEKVEQQVEAEWLEWLDACLEKDEARERHEFGDMIFSLVELGRRHDIKASEALDLACERFATRFETMEALAAEKDTDFSALDMEEKDTLWEEAKKRLAERAKG